MQENKIKSTITTTTTTITTKSEQKDLSNQTTSKQNKAKNVRKQN